jgi:hypothetical protein
VLKRASDFLLVCVLTASLVLGCGLFKPLDERFVLPDRPRHSSSGEFLALVEDGPVQNGVQTWVVVLVDSDGAEVFRDDYAYSTRHGVGVTWLSDEDQLWILSGDVGTAYVERNFGGVWVKAWITPKTRDDIPDEIEALRWRR